MSPETYYRIVLLLLARDSAALGFSLANFFANGGKQILINAATQYGGYCVGKAVGNSITPSIVLPIFANSKLAADFVMMSSSTPDMPTRFERVATVAMAFSTSGLVIKTGDMPTNGAVGGFIAAFVEYMNFVVNSGKTPFIHKCSKRMNLTLKQHIQMQLFLLGLLISISGCLIIIFYTAKIFKRRSCLFLKKSIKAIRKFRPKRLYNSSIVLVQQI